MGDFNDVGEFHEKFGLDNVTYHGTGPRGYSNDELWDILRYRFEFMSEELDEFGNGASGLDHAQMADALVDLVYVALGTAHLLGYPWAALWNAVQAANMRKVRAESGADPRSKRQHSMDVVKPDGWVPPDIENVLSRHGWRNV